MISFHCEDCVDFVPGNLGQDVCLRENRPGRLGPLICHRRNPQCSHFALKLRPVKENDLVAQAVSLPLSKQVKLCAEALEQLDDAHKRFSNKRLTEQDQCYLHAVRKRAGIHWGRLKEMILTSERKRLAGEHDLVCQVVFLNRELTQTQTRLMALEVELKRRASGGSDKSVCSGSSSMPPGASHSSSPRPEHFASAADCLKKLEGAAQALMASQAGLAALRQWIRFWDVKTGPTNDQS